MISHLIAMQSINQPHFSLIKHQLVRITPNI